MAIQAQVIGHLYRWLLRGVEDRVLHQVEHTEDRWRTCRRRHLVGAGQAAPGLLRRSVGRLYGIPPASRVQRPGCRAQSARWIEAVLSMEKWKHPHGMKKGASLSLHGVSLCATQAIRSPTGSRPRSARRTSSPIGAVADQQLKN